MSTEFDELSGVHVRCGSAYGRATRSTQVDEHALKRAARAERARGCGSSGRGTLYPKSTTAIGW